MKQSWELYLIAGNTKKATDMKLKLEKLMGQRPKQKIPNQMSNKIIDEEIDAL